MVDIQSATTEIRRGKKEEIKKKKQTGQNNKYSHNKLHNYVVKRQLSKQKQTMDSIKVKELKVMKSMQN